MVPLQVCGSCSRVTCLYLVIAPKNQSRIRKIQRSNTLPRPLTFKHQGNSELSSLYKFHTRATHSKENQDRESTDLRKSKINGDTPRCMFSLAAAYFYAILMSLRALDEFLCSFDDLSHFLDLFFLQNIMLLSFGGQKPCFEICRSTRRDPPKSPECFGGVRGQELSRPNFMKNEVADPAFRANLVGRALSPEIPRNPSKVDLVSRIRKT